ncbi:MAG: hypothetical protein OK422_00035 [Thaumarchaeota archaeon]|nr:hypothetical protein [Nitrososphaerota archaeon]
MTEQAPADRRHVGELKLPLPVVEKVIVPVAVIGVPPLVSLTRAVQLDEALTAMTAGLQVTPTEVERLDAVDAEVLELLKELWLVKVLEVVSWVMSVGLIGVGVASRK